MKLSRVDWDWALACAVLGSIIGTTLTAFAIPTIHGLAYAFSAAYSAIVGGMIRVVFDLKRPEVPNHEE